MKQEKLCYANKNFEATMNPCITTKKSAESNRIWSKSIVKAIHQYQYKPESKINKWIRKRFFQADKQCNCLEKYRKCKKTHRY